MKMQLSSTSYVAPAQASAFCRLVSTVRACAAGPLAAMLLLPPVVDPPTAHQRAQYPTCVFNFKQSALPIQFPAKGGLCILWPNKICCIGRVVCSWPVTRLRKARNQLSFLPACPGVEAAFSEGKQLSFPKSVD